MTDTAPPKHPAPPGGPGGDGAAAGGGGPTEPTTPSTGGHPGRRRAVVAAVGVAAVVAIGAAVLASQDGDDETTTSPTTTATATTAPPSSSEATETTVTTTAPSSTPGATAPRTTVTVRAQLHDGRHPVYLTGLDVEGRAVEFDLIQFLTGDEADAAYHEDNPDDPGGVPNDYYIVNDNPRLRTLPVAGDVAVTVVTTATSANSPHSIAFEDLPGYVAGDLQPDDQWLWYNPFWLTVEDGTVVDITEQYIP